MDTEPYNKSRTETILAGQGLAQLKGFVEAIVALEEEIEVINEKKIGVYQEVRACGFDKYALRKVITRHRQNKKLLIKQDTLISTYEQAIKGLEYLGEDCPLDT